MRRRQALLALVVVVFITLACGSATPSGVPVSALPTAIRGSPTSAQAAIPPTTLITKSTEAPPIVIHIPTQATTLPPFPTSNLPDLEIMCFQDYKEAGYYHVIGEVRNNTQTPMGSVKVVVTLYDDNKHIIGDVFTYTLLDVILPGKKAPFDLVTDRYAQLARYFIRVEGEVASLGRQDLVISNDESYEQDNYLRIKGLVENKGASDATSVKVVFTLYDKWGIVIGAGFTYTDLDTVPAGGSSPFKAATDHYPNLERYMLQVQGD